MLKPASLLFVQCKSKKLCIALSVNYLFKVTYVLGHAVFYVKLFNEYIVA